MEDKQEAHLEDRAVALACLRAICCDAEARHADRIAAAKLLLESMDEAGAETLSVVMEGIPKEYLV